MNSDYRLVSPAAPIAARGQLRALEAVTAAYPDLFAFLADPAGLDSYFSAARLYFGPDKFPREPFDAIVLQLRTVNARLPWLGERLWQLGPPGDTLLVQTDVKSYGRRIDRGLWTQFRLHWYGQLRELAAPILRLTSEVRRSLKLEEILERAAGEVREIEDRTLSCDAEAAFQKRQAFYRDLRQDPSLRAAAAFLLLRFLESAPIAATLEGNDADLLLDQLIQLRQAPRELLKDRSAVAGLASHLKALVPPVDRLLRDEGVFPRDLRTTRRGTLAPMNSSGRLVFQFRNITRKFHGIWKGIPLGECIGGHASALDSLTPERWASIAIQDARLYHIERACLDHDGVRDLDKPYLGFVQLVPMIDRRNGRLVASLDFGSAALRSRIAVSETGQRETTLPLWELWLRKFSSGAHSPWRDFVVSESNALNNAGVLDSVRLSWPYLLGERQPAAQFRCADTAVRALIGSIPRLGYARQYGGQMIFDGATVDARILTRLRLDVRDEKKGIAALVSQLASRDAVMRWRSALRLLQMGRCETPSVKTLTRELARTCERRLLRLARIAFGRSSENKYTMELWSDTILELNRWLLLRGSQNSEHPLIAHVLASLRRIEREGRTPFVRDAAARALRDCRSLAIVNVRDLSRDPIPLHGAWITG